MSARSRSASIRGALRAAWAMAARDTKRRFGAGRGAPVGATPRTAPSRVGMTASRSTSERTVPCGVPRNGSPTCGWAAKTRLPSRVAMTTVSPASAARRTLAKLRSRPLTLTCMSHRLSTTTAAQPPRSSRLPSDRARRAGYTPGMKTAVSIPDETFEQVERLAKREQRSRSEVYSAALREYVARHAPDEVTEAMNRVCDEIGSESDAFAVAAGRRVLERVEW